MTSKSSGDYDHIMDGVEAIRKILEDGVIVFTKEQAEGLLEILEYKDLMIEDAKYRGAKRLLLAKSRGALIGLAAVISALWLLGNSVMQVMTHLARLLEGTK